MQWRDREGLSEVVSDADRQSDARGRAVAYSARRRKNANRQGALAIHRKDGRWVASLPLAGGGRKYYYAATENEANEKLRDALHLRERERQ
jgi:hypothetical protein